MGPKLIGSIAGLLFLVASFQVGQSLNPLATDKVLGYFGALDTKFKSIEFWKKIVTGVLDADASNSEILDEVKLVSSQIKELGIQLEHKIDKAVMLTAERIRAYAQVDSGIRNLINRMENVDYMYDEYFSRINNKKYDTVFLPEYVKKMLKGEEGPKFEIYKMNRLFYPNRTGSIDKSLFEHIHHQVQLINRERCDDKFSPQLWLFNIYINVMVTEIKAYLMTTLAYTIEAEIDNVSRNLSMSIWTEEFGDRLSNHLRAFREQLSKTPRYIRRCDPEKHVRGETFVEMERLMQLFLIREDQHPARKHCQLCSNLTEFDGNYIKKPGGDAYLAIQPFCNGKVMRCGQYIKRVILDGNICVMPSDSNKLYQWFSTDGRDEYIVHGDDTTCPGTKVDYKRVEKPQWWTHQPELCPYCTCVCADKDHTKTIRSISVRPQISTYRANMVVTGVRLLEKNKLLHIQIKEGYLMPGGRINPSSERWVELEKMDFTTGMIEVVEYNNHIIRKMEQGSDYRNFGEHNFRLAIEDLMAPKGSVIIGVQFTPMEIRKVGFNAIGLTLMTAPFNWTTGQINGEGRWDIAISQRPVVQQRERGENAQRVYNLDIPTKSRANLPMIENSVLEFDIANTKADAGQTVIPFFDSLPIEGNPSLPLGGIGLIYKSSPGYGGFISPRIYHINLADYMDVDNFNEYF